MQPFEIVKDHRLRMDSITKIQRILKEMQESKIQSGYFWIEREHEIYVEILKLYCKDIQSKDERKGLRIFAVMSQILKTRTPKQIKTHHQKMIKRWKDIQGIIVHSCSAYRLENLPRKTKQEKGNKKQVEFTEANRVSMEAKVAQKVAKENVNENEEQSKIDNVKILKKDEETGKVGLIKEEVDYERYYPFLQNGNGQDYPPPQYPWSVATWGYEMAPIMRFYDGMSWI